VRGCCAVVVLVLYNNQIPKSTAINQFYFIELI